MGTKHGHSAFAMLLSQSGEFVNVTAPVISASLIPWSSACWPRDFSPDPGSEPSAPTACACVTMLRKALKVRIRR